VKTLEQLRDELAEQYAATHSVFKVELFGNIVEDYRAGFNAAVQAIQEREKNARVLRLKPRYIKKRGSKGVYLFAGYDCASGSSITMDDPDVIYKVREVIDD
jgi:hypothetical protein